ncbi:MULTISPECIES: aminotransferase class V-fold PLP-dependent enzyme [unclassified Ruminococcus]|uniref:aminotransferase class V-fold PLP-dependent enzyme n=1 Tax=unclassified Ruminococcus TaxID=2608920 RepID=UPI00210CD01B|nr:MULTISPECIES: aminotransferase class V-fold PLP-dependent enzyme [unclassified Ruminococcus]MCQ4022475.1 aminotransferase class V-fold PLP-dependent enzyme [Ruminococcus sp. zg-924]MCQ4115185.1 aminotransferase class V-fold PLP-dependent enzyme [Ruminococcus sp. zg-921]
MIYLDNAATTFPKPQSVVREVNAALTRYGANPGRAGHYMAMKAGKMIYNCRVKLSQLLNAGNEENVVFTLNCTHSLNIVLKGLLKPGDHVVISDLEHNSITRPLKNMERDGITFTQAAVYENDNDKTVQSFREAINGSTRLIACTHASNVWGLRLPVERLASLAHEYGVEILVDAAQSAGVLPIDFEQSGIDYLCMPGHKGLYGPTGTGVMIAKNPEKLMPIMQGGTGSSSISNEQPNFMPDKFECGTANVAGIAGLLRGVEFVSSKTPEKIFSHEMKLTKKLYNSLASNKRIRLYTQYPNEKCYAPLLSFNIADKDSETVARILNSDYGIAVRSGLHCAPSAHIKMGTQEIGAVRVSPSVFTSEYDIQRFLNAVNKIR